MGALFSKNKNLFCYIWLKLICVCAGILEEDEPLPRVTKRSKKSIYLTHDSLLLWLTLIGDYYDDDQASGDLSGVASGMFIGLS